MKNLYPTRRSALSASCAGILKVAIGGLFIEKDANADPVIMLGLINALIALYSAVTQRDAAIAVANIGRDANLAAANINRDAMLTQIILSRETAQSKNFPDFHMQNSDPNKLLQEYNKGIENSLNCQEKISRNEVMTIQNGMPYLHRACY